MSSGRARREHWGLFEAPASPAAEPRLRVDASWSPARLSGRIIASVWRWALSGSLLLMAFGVATMLVPVAIGGLIDSVVAPAASGTPLAGISGALASWTAALAGLYALMNLAYRFGGRLGWFGVQRAQFELAHAMLERVLDERGFAGGSRPPGALLSAATADVHRACLLLYATVYPPGQVLDLAVAAAVLFWVHPLLGAGVMVGSPIVLILTHLVAQPLRRRSLAEQARAW